MLIDFEKIHNARDLGGIVMKDGRQIKEGRFIRCGHLADASEADMAKLATMVDTIIDFRSDKECEEQPDRYPEGITHIHIPIIDQLTAGITREAEADKSFSREMLLNPDLAIKYMCEMYKGFADSEVATAGYAKFIRLLADEHDKAVLWHCTAGKDRAGIGTVILLEILGVDRDEIIRDYLSTNDYLKDDVAFLIEFVKKQTGVSGGVADEALRYLFGAERDYIETYYKEIDARYGSFEEFIRGRDGLGITDEMIDSLT